MTTLAQARQLMADALTAVDGIERVESDSSKALLRAGYGWVSVGEVTPSRFGGVCNAQLAAYVVAGAAKQQADEFVNTTIVAALNAATTYPGLGFADATAEPQSLELGDGQTLYVLTVTITTEVS